MWPASTLAWRELHQARTITESYELRKAFAGRRVLREIGRRMQHCALLFACLKLEGAYYQYLAGISDLLVFTRI